MLKRQSKVLSIALMFVFCMSFMFAGFAAPNVAQAAQYTPVTAPIFGTTETSGELGIIEVVVDNAVGVKLNDVLTISLPSSATIAVPGGTAQAGATIAVGDTVPGAGAPSVFIHVPGTIPGTTVTNALAGTLSENVGAIVNFDTATTGHGTAYGTTFAGPPSWTATGTGSPSAKIGGTHQSVDIKFTGNGAPGKGVMYIYINSAKVSASEDIVATVMGSNSAVFGMGQVTIGKVISGSGTTATVKSVKTLGSAGGATDVITIIETKTNTFKNSNLIKIKLPAGYGWSDVAGATIVSTNWAFQGYTVAAGDLTVTPKAGGDARLLTIKFNNAAFNNNRANTGRLDIVGTILIEDDSVAKKGEIIANVYGDNVTDQDITVAQLADYQVTVAEDSVKEVVAGWDATEVGSFKIKEEMAGSLIPGREISLTLPDGVKWNTNAAAGVWPNLGVTAANVVTIENEKGTAAFVNANPGSTSNNGRTLKFTLTNPAGGFTKSTLVFKKLQVAIRPDFSGDLNVEIGGNAGVTGTAKVATVSPALTLENDGKAKIIIGAQDQAVGDILLKETVKEGIDATKGDKSVRLNLPEGAKWSVTPTVEVTEGDVSIDTVTKDGIELCIKFKSSSSKPSTIKISGIKVTTNRVMPEGDIKLSIARGSNAITDNAGPTKFDLSTISSVVIGQCVTPAPGEGTEGAGAGEFRIDSNIYYVAGVAKVMDVAPYIKSDRTYVPMRYLGEILGAEVEWDEAARKVTLNKDEITVEFTIGSTTYTVNDEAKTADVAPEITNDRTMLPARFVAEAFGSVVGWDPGTRTVLISK